MSLWHKELYDKLPLSSDRFTIRLVRILPGPEGSEIRCKMFCRSLTGSPLYRALSYNWGLSEELKSITVNGIRVPVRLNLEQALRNLQHEKERQTLWIDALCINQEDLDERSVQVQGMGDIYSYAHQVLIWIREAHDDAIETEHEWDLAARLSRNETEYFSEMAIRTIIRLFNKRWWKRVWVVQEVSRAQAEPLVCLHRSLQLRWSELVQFVNGKGCRVLERGLEKLGTLGALQEIRAMTKTPPRLRDSYYDEDQTRPDMLRESLGKDLFRLLTMTAQFDGTDPRDRIFGLCSLARGTSGHHLQPDYNKSISEVYCEVTNAIIKDTNSLDILIWGGLQSRRRSTSHQPLNLGLEDIAKGEILNIPSWVPDYSVVDRPPRFPPHPTLASFARCNSLDKDSVTYSNGALGLNGRSFGVVNQIFQSSDIKEDLYTRVLLFVRADLRQRRLDWPFDRLALILELVKHLRSDTVISTRGLGMERIERFGFGVKTIEAFNDFRILYEMFGESNVVFHELDEISRAIFHWFRGIRSSIDINDRSDWEAMWRKFQQTWSVTSLQQWSDCYRFFETSTGFVGLDRNHSVSIGHEVMLLENISTACVLSSMVHEEMDLSTRTFEIQGNVFIFKKEGTPEGLSLKDCEGLTTEKLRIL